MAADQKALKATGRARPGGCGARTPSFGVWRTAIAVILLLVPHAAPVIRASAPSRVISLVPAATEMLFAIGAGPQVVGVGSYDNYPPETARLPRVGALLDPDIERILSLRPDLAIIYDTQTDLARQLQRAGIATFDYHHAGIADVTETLRRLGFRTGHTSEAERVASTVENGLARIRTAVAGLPRPKTLLVFGRERLALRGIYASGGVGFLDDMLSIAGGENVFADVKQQSVQASTETVIARQPEAIVEIHSADAPLGHEAIQEEIRTWSILASVPAVRTGRIYYLVDDRLVIPGPRIAEGTRLIAAVLHPGAVK
ncbi:MAG TPA: helical backbone metal receptor [Vicinamibacterales bacterium]|jgi:cobalamin transport system substrate-binding protein|nr:helical backbone metal receptor [Vicinamibacterales bacterium]